MRFLGNKPGECLHYVKVYFFYRLSDEGTRKERYDFSDSWASTRNCLVEEGCLKEAEVEDCAKSLTYSIADSLPQGLFVHLLRLMTDKDH